MPRPTPDTRRPTRQPAAPSLYLITDRRRTAGRPLLEVVEQALQGGVDAVQLREKDLPARELLVLAQALRQLCSQHGARLLINDRIDVAIAAGADGVHLPASSFSASDARTLLGPEALIGVSTHSPAEVRAAAQAGADFVVFGPVYDTPSKRAYGPPQGLAALAAVTRTAPLPVVAVGGITADRVAETRAHGAAGVAVIGAILEAADPGASSERLR